MPNKGAALKYSVVTPTLNQGHFLKETIQSVQDQKYPFKEHIVVDGGSSDDTFSILKDNEDHLKWASLPGLGQSGAINHGWKISTGDILSWLNSDDLLVPGALEKVSETFETHPDVDIIYGDCLYIDRHGGFISQYPTQPFNYETLVRKAITYIPQPSTFMRRKVFERLGGTDEKLSYVMDLDYWMRAGLYFEFLHLPEVLSKLRLHSEAKSVAKLSKFAKEIISVYEAYFSREDLPPHIRALKRTGLRNAYFVAAHYCFWAREFHLARLFAIKGWREQPFHPTPYLPIYFMGRFGFRWASRVWQNPYTKGSQ